MEGLSFLIDIVRDQILSVSAEMMRPSVLYRPRIGIDGNMWGVVYGDNIQDGVAGFGPSPAAAMADFDKRWNEALHARAASDKWPLTLGTSGMKGMD